MTTFIWVAVALLNVNRATHKSLSDTKLIVTSNIVRKTRITTTLAERPRDT